MHSASRHLDPLQADLDNGLQHLTLSASLCVCENGHLPGVACIVNSAILSRGDARKFALPHTVTMQVQPLLKPHTQLIYLQSCFVYKFVPFSAAGENTEFETLKLLVHLDMYCIILQLLPGSIYLKSLCLHFANDSPYEMCQHRQCVWKH